MLILDNGDLIIQGINLIFKNYLFRALLDEIEKITKEDY